MVKAVLTVPEVAVRWGCAEESVHGMVRRGELAAFQVGEGKKRPRLRIALTVIEQFEKEGNVRPEQPAAPLRRKKKRAIPRYV